jgi:hypothetical protein
MTRPFITLRFSAHFDMDRYPFGRHHTATIGFTIRDVELAAIKAWTDAWEVAKKGGAHPAEEGHHH